MGQSALCPAKMKRCPAQSRTANAIDTTPAPRKDAAPAARPKGPAAKKVVQKTPTSHSGGQRGTSTWWYKVPAHGERARCNFVLHNAILLARAAGEQYSRLVCSLPSHGLTHNGGLSSRRLTPLRCILALTVPVVRGLATPFLLCRRLAHGGLYGRRRPGAPPRRRARRPKRLSPSPHRRYAGAGPQWRPPAHSGWRWPAPA